MNLKHHTTKILVVDLGTKENQWLMFCGYDEVKDRLILFRTLSMGSLPAYHTRQMTTITITRDGKEFSTGSPYLTSGHQETYRLVGLAEIEKDAPEDDKLEAFNFLTGDIITIDKFDWKESEIPLDSITTRRTVGTLFGNVFYGELHKKLRNFFIGISFQTTTVVFESYPGKEYAKYF
jgi:hypothetical protein